MPKSSESNSLTPDSTFYYHLIFMLICDVNFIELIKNLYNNFNVIDFNTLLSDLYNSNYRSLKYENTKLKTKLKEYFDRIKKLQPSIEELPKIFKKTHNPPNNPPPAPSKTLKDERLPPIPPKSESEITPILTKKLLVISNLIIKKGLSNIYKTELEEIKGLIFKKLVEK